MHFATLASGSWGNSILVGCGERGFLIDSGLSAKRLLQNLNLVGVNPRRMEGIIVTHEHIDHIRGVGVLARSLKIPVLTTRGIWEEMGPQIGALQPEQIQIVDERQEIELAGLKVKLFATSHDSRESYGLRIQSLEKTLGIATDTGSVTGEMQQNLKGCDALIVEANHDPEKLWQGPYPWMLKKRVAGNRGHLSNAQLGEALQDWLEEKTQKVVLAHLSEQNNTPSLALETVVRILRDSSVKKRCPHLGIRVAPRFVPHELITLPEEAERSSQNGVLQR